MTHGRRPALAPVVGQTWFNHKDGLTVWTQLPLLLRGQRVFPQKVVQTGAMATQGVIRGHEPGHTRTHTQIMQIETVDNAGVALMMFPWSCDISSGESLSSERRWWNTRGSGGDPENRTNCLLVIHKGVHEQPLLDAFLPLGPFPLEVPVRVVGDDHAVQLVRQLDDEAVVVADHPLAPDSTWRSKDHDLTFFQLRQDVLIWKCSRYTGYLRKLWGEKNVCFHNAATCSSLQVT